MAGGGYTVNIGAMNETATGINNTISDLDKLGFSETAGTGMGFTALTLSTLQLGHPGLTSAFRNFTGRWQWGVRSLVQDGNQIAQRLGLNAGAYWQADQKVIGSLKDLVVAAAGDPHETDAQAAAGSWSQAAAEFTGAKTPSGNMTWQQAQQEIEAQWKAEGKDVLQNGWKSPLVNPAGPAISATQSVTGVNIP